LKGIKLNYKKDETQEYYTKDHLNQIFDKITKELAKNFFY
jgi:hypothetical protein